jgi:hypothetical protein
MIAFIDDHHAAYGVEPICGVLPIAPSTYHAHAEPILAVPRPGQRAIRGCARRSGGSRTSRSMAGLAAIEAGGDRRGALHRGSSDAPVTVLAGQCAFRRPCGTPDCRDGHHLRWDQKAGQCALRPVRTRPFPDTLILMPRNAIFHCSKSPFKGGSSKTAVIEHDLKRTLTGLPASVTMNPVSAAGQGRRMKWAGGI